MIIAPILRKTDVRDVAVRVRKQLDPNLAIPVPVEELIEFRLTPRVRILPLRDMKKVTGYEAYLGCRRTRIVVDEYIQSSCPQRYRFTLAHELGHYFLHSDIYDRIDGREDLIRTVREISDDQWTWLRRHADWFASYFLMPPGEFAAFLDAETTRAPQEVREDGFLLLEYLSEVVSQRFDVSRPAAFIRIQTDRL